MTEDDVLVPMLAAEADLDIDNDMRLLFAAASRPFDGAGSRIGDGLETNADADPEDPDR